MFKNKFLYLPLILAVVFFMIVEFMRPKPIDWRPTFLKNDKIPYGCYILYSHLNDLFPGQSIGTNNESFYTFFKERSFEKTTNLLIIDQQFEPGKLDFDALLDFVAAGNNLFISASDFGDAVKDSLGFRTGFTNNLNDSLNLYINDDSFGPFRVPLITMHFLDFDSAGFKALGKNNKEHTVWIERKFEQGKIMLHSTPYILGNYNLLVDNFHN